MSNLQPNCCLKFHSLKVDQHAGGKWLIHDTKHRKVKVPHKESQAGPLATQVLLKSKQAHSWI